MAAWKARSTANWRVVSLLNVSSVTDRCLSNSLMYNSNFCKRRLILLTFSFTFLLHYVSDVPLPVTLQTRSVVPVLAPDEGLQAGDSLAVSGPQPSAARYHLVAKRERRQVQHANVHRLGPAGSSPFLQFAQLGSGQVGPRRNGDVQVAEAGSASLSMGTI